MKMQIFTVLKEVIHTYKGRYRKEKLLALQRLYQFCAKQQVADIEIMTLAKEQQFEQELSERFRGEKKSAVFGILRMSRKILFLQAPEIHWNANVWFLERFHFSRERMNPSKPVEWVSFKEVTNLENQKILQKYLRYLFGITDLSISTIRIKLQELRTFLVYFNGEENPIHEVEAEKIQRYLEWESAYTFSFSPDILSASNHHSSLHNHHLSGYTLRFPEFPYTISAGTSAADVPETLPASIKFPYRFFLVRCGHCGHALLSADNTHAGRESSSDILLLQGKKVEHSSMLHYGIKC